MTEQPTWRPACVICASRGRTRHLDHGHVCPACRTGLAVDLAALVDAAAIAAVIPDPYAVSARTGPRRKPGSRPPLDLAHVDPALVLVRAVPDDPSSEEPLLVLLESWCRAVREDRDLVPYGVATEGKPVTLAGTVAFLRSHVDWMADEPSFAVDEFAGHVRRGLAALRAMDPATERGGWRVPCPSDAPSRPERASQSDEQPEVVQNHTRVTQGAQSAVCGFRLSVDPTNLNGDLTCPRCRTEWTPQRLLLLALNDPNVVVWAHSETIADALGITPRTLQRWARLDLVGKRGTLYDAGGAFRQRHSGTAV